MKGLPLKQTVPDVKRLQTATSDKHTNTFVRSAWDLRQKPPRTSLSQRLISPAAIVYVSMEAKKKAPGTALRSLPIPCSIPKNSAGVIEPLFAVLPSKHFCNFMDSREAWCSKGGVLPFKESLKLIQQKGGILMVRGNTQVNDRRR